MAASILQSGNAAATPGGTYANPYATLIGPSAVTAGSTILALVGYDFDTAATTFTCTDTLGQTYSQVDYLSKSGDFNAALFICESTAAMPAPIAGTLSGAVSVGAISATLASAWTGPTRTYVVTFSSGEVRAVTLTNGSAAMSWGGALGSAATSAITIGYGPIFTGTTNGDYTIAVAAEIAGVATSVLVAHNAAINNAVAIGSNNVNPGPLACGSGSGLMVSIVLNVANGNGSPTNTPKIGSSPVAFTQYGSPFWNFGSTPLGILQYAHLSAPGTLTPTAGTQETVADDYYMWSVFLADAGTVPDPLHPGSPPAAHIASFGGIQF